MICIKADIPKELNEIDDELKAIYHSKDTARIIFTDLSNLISCLTVFMFPPLFFHKSYTKIIVESVP